jgi:hypothetical protein
MTTQARHDSHQHRSEIGQHAFRTSHSTKDNGPEVVGSGDTIRTTQEECAEDSLSNTLVPFLQINISNHRLRAESPGRQDEVRLKTLRVVVAINSETDEGSNFYVWPSDCCSPLRKNN